MNPTPKPKAAVALAAAAALWLILLITGGPDSAWDTALLRLLYSGNSPFITSGAAVLTHLGGWMVLVSLTLAAAALLALRRRIADALLLLGITGGGRILVELQKYLTDRPRPPEAEQLVQVHALSFPSGHAANSTITYLALALLLASRADGTLRRSAFGLGLLLSLLIGLTRPVLGVHWPSDVVAGWTFGSLWTIGLFHYTRSDRTRGQPH